MPSKRSSPSIESELLRREAGHKVLNSLHSRSIELLSNNNNNVSKNASKKQLGMVMHNESTPLKMNQKTRFLPQLCVLTFPFHQWSHDLSTKQPLNKQKMALSSSSSSSATLSPSNSSKVFKCRPPSSASLYFFLLSPFLSPTSSSVSPHHQLCHRALHIVAFFFFLVTLLLLTTTASTVSANSNTQSFPTFSYCSYIFINNEERHSRPSRSPSAAAEEELNAVITTTPSSPLSFTPAAADDDQHSVDKSREDEQQKFSSPLPAPPSTHAHHQHTLRHHASTRSAEQHSTSSSGHHHHHHQSEGEDENLRHTTHSAHSASHHLTPTQMTSTTTRHHSHKSRRSAEGETNNGTTGAATPPIITSLPTTLPPPLPPPPPPPPAPPARLPAESIPFESSSPYPEFGSSLPPEFFKQSAGGDERHIFNSQHYYQQSFQHQFQFSYSPPSNSHPVYIGLEIIDVDLINDAKNFFSLQLHVFELWHEPRLNTSALQMFWATNSDPIPVNEANIADCLWTPQLVFEDSSESEQLLQPTTILLAYQNRVLLRKSRHSLKVRCHMNLQVYPMDKHKCLFKLRTFTDPVHKVDLRWLNDAGSPRQDLLDLKDKKCVIHAKDFTPSLFDIRLGDAVRQNHPWLNENYSMLAQEFIFERRMIHSLLTVYIPSSLVVTLSWLQFWFDVEAVPGRMSLGIMSTLTIMTQILTNYEKAGNHVTAVDIWLFVCLIMVFLALMEYAVAYTISHFNEDLDGMETPPLSLWPSSVAQHPFYNPHHHHHLQLGNAAGHKPLSGQTSAGDNLSYSKVDGDPFFAAVGPIRSNILRNSLRNRRNGSNLAVNQQQQQSTAHTPVVNFEGSSDNLFNANANKGLTTHNNNNNNNLDDLESGTMSHELVVAKDNSLDPVTQSPSPQPNQVIEEEEKLLGGGNAGGNGGGGHTTDEEVTSSSRRSPKRDYMLSSSASPALHHQPPHQPHHHHHHHHHQQQHIDHQLEIARSRVELAIEEYQLLVKEQMLEQDHRSQTMPNSIVPAGAVDDSLSQSGGGNGKGSSKRRKFRSHRGGAHEGTPDPNNNNNFGNSGKSSAKSSRFSSLRRPPLRRQASSRMSHVERSPSGLSYVDYVSRFIFPAAFVLFGLVYWAILFYFKFSPLD